MNMEVFITIVFWLILCIILANAGSKRNIGGAGAFFISFFLSPLIGFIVVVVSEKKQKVTCVFKSGETKQYYENDVKPNVGYIITNTTTGVHEVRKKLSRKESKLLKEFDGFIPAKEYLLSLMKSE